MNFEWQGTENPFYMPLADLRLQAERWGIEAEAADSHQKLQPLVVAAAAREYQQQFKAALDAAWQAALDGSQPAEEVRLTEEVQPTEEVQLTDEVQPTMEVHPTTEVQPTEEVQPTTEVQPTKGSSAD